MGKDDWEMEGKPIWVAKQRGEDDQDFIRKREVRRRYGSQERGKKSPRNTKLIAF